MTIKEKLKEFLNRRQAAYRLVFNTESVATQRVIKDLAKFCRANETCFHPDPRAHAVAEGRREVWLRIMDHTKLNTEDFWKKYGREDLP